MEFLNSFKKNDLHINIEDKDFDEIKKRVQESY